MILFENYLYWQVLYWGLLQGREPVGGGVAGLWAWRLVSTVSWWRWAFAEGDKERFGEVVLG